jgi:hypothetical protein
MTKKELADKKAILRYYAMGFGLRWLAAETGVFKENIKRILKEEGVYEGDRKLPAGKRGEIHSVIYWARCYDIPEGSAYLAVRKRGHGEIQNWEIGAPKLLSEREFLASVVITRQGQKIIAKMLEKGILLTAKEIKSNLTVV